VIERHENNGYIQEALQRARIRTVPQWLELDADKPKGKVLHLPSREQIDTQVTEQLIVEFYSK
jgi:small subunit ribosomal protein S4